MNKKVLTLCAGFLLGGSLAVVAENIQVKEASQLANGAKYKVVAITSKGDSIMTEGTQTFPLVTGSGSYNAPKFEERKGNQFENDSIWTLVKVDGGFQLKATTNAIRNGGNGDLYTNDANGAVKFTYNPADGALTVDGDTVYVYDTGASYDKSRTAGKGSKKFAFYLQENTVAENSLVEGSTQLDEISGAIFVLDSDGKYVGYSETPYATKAIAEGAYLKPIAAEEFLKLEDKTSYVWKKSGDALESAYYAGIYLTVNDKGELDTTDQPQTVAFENTVLTAGDNSASVSITSSSVLPPFSSIFFNGAADQDASKVVLYTSENSLVVNAANELVKYDPSDAVETVWSLDAKEISKGKYELRFKDADGNYLTVGDEYVTVDNVTWGTGDDAGKYTLPKDGIVILRAGDKYVAVESGELVANAGAHEATYFGLGAIDVARVNAATLLNRYGEYFTLDITYLKDEVGQTDLTSIFEGKLTPMERVVYTPEKVTYNKATSEYDKEFMLVNEEGNILAVNMDEDDRLSEGETNHVYPLTTITPHEYALDQAQQDPAKRIYATRFYFDYEPGTAIENSSSVNITAIHALTDAGRSIELGAYLDKKVPTLVAKDGAGLLDVTIELNKGTLVVAKEWLNQPAYYTVEVLNKAKYAEHKDQVLGLNENGAIDYVAATKTDINRPEGQFAISYEDDKWYHFTNRETGETTKWLDSDKLYKISSTEFAYLAGDHIDTLAIKPVTTYKSSDGFRRYSAADLNNNTYNIAMNLLDESFLYVVENHNDKHRIGLDREDATEWRIEIPTVKLLDAAGAQKALVADTVKVPATIKYWKDNKWVKTDDKTSKNVDGSYKYYDPNTVLEICTYILKNTDTDEYMMGSSDAEEEANAYYYCPSETQATRIALKLVGDSTVNLVPVYGVYPVTSYYVVNWMDGMSRKEDVYNDYAKSLSLSDWKIIGGTTSATGVLKDVDLYEATSKDLFVIKEAAAPTYKKMEQGQKIVISRVENNDEVIYEKGEFAGIDNIKAYTDINPTLYVDTAYVNREGNYRYEYLLGVNINRVDSIDDCGNPNHEHPRTVFTEGRFLVNMRDSADANTNVHNNKFEYDYESKLAFVSGYHQNDTLYITDEAGKVIAKSEVGNAAPHFAKFAFKMINETNNEFVIEVGESAAKQSIYKNGMWQTVVNTEDASRGYLRWHNGNLVVTPYLDQAEHFTMEASDKEATANEAISAGNVVVAGTNGAVVVKGAEGKNVIVSTILGKVVANEVVSSDNTQIATPAGIVVVSVDGESFKVVVK